MPYAEPLGQGGEVVQLTSAWRLAWTPATGALLELAGLAGVTQELAAVGAPVAGVRPTRRYAVRSELGFHG